MNKYNSYLAKPLFYNLQNVPKLKEHQTKKKNSDGPLATANKIPSEFLTHPDGPLNFFTI